MPRERTDFFRKSNSKPREKIIVLAYEGNNTEAIYFESVKESARFNDDLIYLVSLRRKKTDTNSAPIHVFNKLKKDAKDEYNFDKTDELWMVIDRDHWSNIPEICEMCKQEGNFFLALSNPCFELWLLLHIKDLSEFNNQQLNDIYTNAKVSNRKTYLKQLLGQLLEDGYDESNPKPNRFIVNIDQAILRAKKLDVSSEEYPNLLGSHVYKIVDKIITKSTKA